MEPKHGHLYKLRSRNLTYGVYNENIPGFVGIREKKGFGRFLEIENNGTGRGAATAEAEIGRCPVTDLSLVSIPLFDFLDAIPSED